MIKQFIYIAGITFSILSGGCNLIDKDEYVLDYKPLIPEGADINRILLEDYTGMQCSNCPRAAAKAQTLLDSHGERLIVVSIHAGYFARPLGEHDLRTAAGEAYNAYFKVSSNPQGIMNRTPYNGSAFYSMYQWDEVIKSIPLTAPVSLDLNVAYTPDKRTFSLDMEIKRYHPSPKEDVDLVIWLVEDSISTKQIIEDGSLVDNYMQRHVLRDALNGIWGEPVSLPAQNGQSATIRKDGFVLAESFNDKNCSVVAFICERNSKKILQVNTAPIL